VITASDTRGRKDDPSGDTAARLLERAGHRIVHRAWVRDRTSALRRAARSALAKATVDVVVVTGGTGVADRDCTPEALGPLMDKRLPGFGERFRALSVRQVGSASWLSRADAGIARGRLLVLLPGSTAAVTLAVRRLLVPELGHVVRLLGRFAGGS
jgi:molybdenum cofactor biosynthesis protein B